MQKAAYLVALGIIFVILSACSIAPSKVKLFEVNEEGRLVLAESVEQNEDGTLKTKSDEKQETDGESESVVGTIFGWATAWTVADTIWP